MVDSAIPASTVEVIQNSNVNYLNTTYTYTNMGITEFENAVFGGIWKFLWNIVSFCFSFLYHFFVLCAIVLIISVGTYLFGMVLFFIFGHMGQALGLWTLTGKFWTPENEDASDSSASGDANAGARLDAAEEGRASANIAGEDTSSTNAHDDPSEMHRDADSRLSTEVTTLGERVLVYKYNSSNYYSSASNYFGNTNDLSGPWYPQPGPPGPRG